MRGVVFGLLLANLLMAVCVFLLSKENRNSQPVALPVASQSAPTSITLLRDLTARDLVPYAKSPEVLVNRESADELSVPAQAAPQQLCLEFGPIATRQIAESVIAAVSPNIVMETQVRTLQLSPAYRVYLSPYRDRDTAVENLQNLRASLTERNLSIETLLITRGELSNGIALGLFSEQRNALNVKEQVEALGFPVTLREEGQQEEQLWLASQPFEFEGIIEDLRVSFAKLEPAAELLEKICKTIAQDIQLP
jgi:hypothetical protein